MIFRLVVKKVYFFIPYNIYENLVEFYLLNRKNLKILLKNNIFNNNLLINYYVIYIFDKVFNIQFNKKNLYLKIELFDDDLLLSFMNFFYIFINSYLNLIKSKCFKVYLLLKLNWYLFINKYQLVSFNALDLKNLKNNFIKLYINDKILFINKYSFLILYKKKLKNIKLILNLNTLDYNLLLQILKKIIKLKIDKNFIFFFYLIFNIRTKNNKELKLLNLNNLQLYNKDYLYLKNYFKIKDKNFYKLDMSKKNFKWKIYLLNIYDIFKFRKTNDIFLLENFNYFIHEYFYLYK